MQFQIASHVLAYANSCVNPILYAFFSPAFRRAFQDFLKKKSNKNLRWYSKEAVKKKHKNVENYLPRKFLYIILHLQGWAAYDGGQGRH